MTVCVRLIHSRGSLTGQVFQISPLASRDEGLLIDSRRMSGAPRVPLESQIRSWNSTSLVLKNKRSWIINNVTHRCLHGDDSGGKRTGDTEQQRPTSYVYVSSRGTIQGNVNPYPQYITHLRHPGPITMVAAVPAGRGPCAVISSKAITITMTQYGDKLQESEESKRRCRSAVNAD